MTVTAYLPPMIRFQPLVAGAPIPGGKVWTYQAGTSTPQVTYQSDGVTPNANPIILDANGACDLRLGSGLSYKINVMDANNVQVAGWPQDRVDSPDMLVTTIMTDLADASTVGKGDTLIGVLIPAAGAVARTQHDVNQDFISVFNWMTPAQIADVRAGTLLLDVSAAIQAAINSGIKRIWFPLGSYRMLTGVTINANGIDLQGASNYGTVWKYEGTTGAAITIASTVGVAGFRMSNLRISGGYDSATSYGVQLGSSSPYYAATHLRFDTVDIVNFKNGPAFKVGTAWTVQISNCLLSHNLYGLHFPADANNCTTFLLDQQTYITSGDVGILISAPAAGALDSITLDNVIIESMAYEAVRCTTPAVIINMFDCYLEINGWQGGYGSIYVNGGAAYDFSTLNMDRTMFHATRGITGGLIASTAMVNGTTYIIVSTGTSNFMAVGAGSNNVETRFVASGPTPGTGTVYASTTTGNDINLGDYAVARVRYCEGLNKITTNASTVAHFEFCKGHGGSNPINVYKALPGRISAVDVDESGYNRITYFSTQLSYLHGDKSFRDAHISTVQTATTTVSASVGAGSSPTATLLAGSTDTAGQIQITSGASGWTASNLFFLTYSKTYGSAPIVVISPANAKAANMVAACKPYVDSYATTFAMVLNVADTSSGQSLWNYHVIGRD